MSTELKPFKLLHLEEITLTRFYGGAKNGVSLQLNQRYHKTGEYGFIQISHKDAAALAELLTKFAERPMEYPEPSEDSTN